MQYLLEKVKGSSGRVVRKHTAFAPANSLLGEGQWVKKPFEG
jgi:hypothetical protein